MTSQRHLRTSNELSGCVSTRARASSVIFEKKAAHRGSTAGARVRRRHWEKGNIKRRERDNEMKIEWWRALLRAGRWTQTTQSSWLGGRLLRVRKLQEKWRGYLFCASKADTCGVGAACQKQFLKPGMISQRWTPPARSELRLRW